MTADFPDVPYGPHAEQVVDLHIPQGVAPPDGWPIMIFLHGGGDTSSDEDINVEKSPLHSALLANGIAIASADYVGFEEAQWPVPQSHVVDLIRWMHAQTAYGYDVTRIGIMGRSFGGMLASCVCYGSFGVQGNFRPRCFVSVQGMVDWTALDSTMTFAAAEHLQAGGTSTGQASPLVVQNASGLQWMYQLQAPLQEYFPPVYSWYKGTVGQVPLTNVHDPYFGVELDATAQLLGLESKLYIDTPGPPVTVPSQEIAEWILRVMP